MSSPNCGFPWVFLLFKTIKICDGPFILREKEFLLLNWASRYILKVRSSGNFFLLFVPSVFDILFASFCSFSRTSPYITHFSIITQRTIKKFVSTVCTDLDWSSSRLKSGVGLGSRILSLRIYDRESFISQGHPTNDSFQRHQNYLKWISLYSRSLSS